MRFLPTPILFVALALTGCPTPPTTVEPLPACEEVSEACHEVEGLSTEAHECHEMAHDATMNATCVAFREMCLSVCTSLDGGVHDEDAEHEH
jgi:hypothetical protein